MKVANDDKQMRSDWTLPICSGNERIKKLGKTLHPTQKPESLLNRIIISSTKKGDTILDPFFGTGSTGVVAKRLGRIIIGIEQNKEYMKYAKNRLKNTKTLNNKELTITKNLKTEIKIPFGNLLDNGMLEIGSKLHDINKKHNAIIRADGSLFADKKFEGSIHTVGAKLQGHNACNGWQYWHYEKNGELVSINKLREKIRNNKNKQSN
jgi:16S rRNA G966 N2-methylase RsmD